MRNKFIRKGNCAAIFLFFVMVTSWLTPQINASEFTDDLAVRGGIINDLSESNKIKLAQPHFGLVNISAINSMPQSKTDELHAWLEFSDGEGNYFKKRIITSAQGSSSLGYPKKNIKFDLCEDEWEGDETTDVTFGNWVKQDGFHLKAYFIDYFRGVGAVSYDIYDEIVSTRGDKARPWQRAGADNVDDKALGHPAGFPVAVYLNGDFYGVYAWQLSKHRKNMGMDKNTPEHIHLDGEITTQSVLNGTIDWTKFEIRNPKGLYCKDGNKYDGDNPRELIDEKSSLFNPDNEGHVLSAKVKNYIKAMSKYFNEIGNSWGSGEEGRRREFEKRFDIDGFIDYTIFSSIVNNVDGWWKNWQWITYDGVKWCVMPYDLDMTFGNVSFGTFVSPPEYNWYYSDPYQRFRLDVGPAYFCNEIYASDLDRRYAELRDNGIITAENVYSKIEDWYNRVSVDMYEREFSRWPESMCNRDMVLSLYWEWTGTWIGFNNYPDWNGSQLYQEGDICKANNMLFRAKTTVKGDFPVRQAGYHDGLDRIHDWINRRIEMEDILWNYKRDAIEPVSVPAEAKEISAIYNLQGLRLSTLQPGINIVLYSDGTTAKIFR